MRSTVYVNSRPIEVEAMGASGITPFSLFLANLLRVSPSHQVAVDAGAGSGILAIVLAQSGVGRVVAIERSADACELIALNARLNGVASQIEIVNQDIAGWSPGSYVDLVVSNPPTVPETDGGPGYVLGSGADGTAFLRLLLRSTNVWLSPQGELQTIISSLVGDDLFNTLCASAGLIPTPVGTLILPLRDFYYGAYPQSQLDEYMAVGRVIPEERDRRPQLSETLKVYFLRR